MRNKLKTTLFTSIALLSMSGPIASTTVFADSNSADSNTQGLVSKSKNSSNSNKSTTNSSSTDKDSTDKDKESTSANKDNKNDSANTSANTSTNTSANTKTSSSTTATPKATTRTKLPKTGFNDKTIFSVIVSLGILMLTSMGLTTVLKKKEN